MQKATFIASTQSFVFDRSKGLNVVNCRVGIIVQLERSADRKPERVSPLLQNGISERGTNGWRKDMAPGQCALEHRAKRGVEQLQGTRTRFCCQADKAEPVAHL